MVLGGISWEFCVRTRPEGEKQEIKKENLDQYFRLHKMVITVSKTNPPAMTGDTAVCVLKPLLFTVFVIMNLIGAAEDVGVFFDICGNTKAQFHSH